MKKLISLLAILFAFTPVFSQATKKVAIQDLDLTEPTKAFNGTSWVNPLSKHLKKLDSQIDTLELGQPRANRFYFNRDTFDKYEPHAGIGYEIWDDRFVIGLNDADWINELKPFMIKNNEVTNKEYKEFLSTLSGDDYKNMMPDTNCWQTDFIHSYNEPMVRYYYQHPKYEDYPLVGVSYYQAESYCAWLEAKLNGEEAVEGYRIEVGLPNQFQWAFANGDGYSTWWRTSSTTTSKYLGSTNTFFDHNYMLNLVLDISDSSFSLLTKSLIPAYANLNSSNFINDGYMYTTSCAIPKRMKNPVLNDKMGVTRFLNTNVSEWCSESYVDNWKELHQARQEVLRKSGKKDLVLLADLEAYYNSLSDTVTGRMVRGGNWLHENHAYRNGANVGTQTAKAFLDPNAQHSTLGFRYVIRLIPIEDPAN